MTCKRSQIRVLYRPPFPPSPKSPKTRIKSLILLVILHFAGVPYAPCAPFYSYRFDAHKYPINTPSPSRRCPPCGQFPTSPDTVTQPTNRQTGAASVFSGFTRHGDITDKPTRPPVRPGGGGLPRWFMPGGVMAPASGILGRGGNGSPSQGLPVAGCAAILGQRCGGLQGRPWRRVGSRGSRGVSAGGPCASVWWRGSRGASSGGLGASVRSGASVAQPGGLPGAARGVRGGSVPVVGKRSSSTRPRPVR